MSSSSSFVFLCVESPLSAMTCVYYDFRMNERREMGHWLLRVKKVMSVVEVLHTCM